MKIHSRNLHAPIHGIFCLNSVAVARYAALIRSKSSANCDAHLAESIFQTHSKKEPVCQTGSEISMFQGRHLIQIKDASEESKNQSAVSGSAQKHGDLCDHGHATDQTDERSCRKSGKCKADQREKKKYRYMVCCFSVLSDKIP